MVDKGIYRVLTFCQTMVAVKANAGISLGDVAAVPDVPSLLQKQQNCPYDFFEHKRGRERTPTKDATKYQESSKTARIVRAEKKNARGKDKTLRKYFTLILQTMEK